jgi:hypothetical protein
MLGSNTGCVLANLFGCKYDPNAIISALSINYNLKGLDFTKTSNINGDAIFALYKQSTTTTTTVAPSSCFSNWPYGTFYSSPFGKIVGLTSGTVWGASFGPLNLLNFKLDNDPSTQTKSFFYKKNVSSSDFIIGEQISLSGFQNDPNNNNLNGTYYLTDTKINGGDLYHEIQCNPPPATTTTTTIIPPSPKPPERQTIDAFLKLYYSGGGANNDPLKSLGGNISNFIIKSSKNNIFENVSGDIYEEGLTDYRCVYVKNNSLNRIFYLYFALDDFFLGSIQNLGFNFVNEVQTVTVLNGPFVNGQTLVFSYEGKNFTVVYDTNFAQWLLNFNSAIKQVASLEDVVVTGNSNGSNAIFEITFEGTAGYKNHPLIVLVGYNLSPTPSVSILKSISGSPINSIAEKIAATTNEPNNITFYDATVNSPVYLPILNPGDFLPIWLRRIVYPNTIAVENDGCKLIISGNYEVIEE